MNAIQWGGIALIGFNVGLVAIRAIVTRKQRSEALRVFPWHTDGEPRPRDGIYGHDELLDITD